MMVSVCIWVFFFLFFSWVTWLLECRKWSSVNSALSVLIFIIYQLLRRVFFHSKRRHFFQVVSSRVLLAKINPILIFHVWLLHILKVAYSQRVFLVWLKSPKKDAKHYPPKKKMLRIVIWHLSLRFWTNWKRFWDWSTYSFVCECAEISCIE